MLAYAGHSVSLLWHSKHACLASVRAETGFNLVHICLGIVRHVPGEPRTDVGLD
jgi:hypothetical protein